MKKIVIISLVVLSAFAVFLSWSSFGGVQADSTDDLQNKISELESAIRKNQKVLDGLSDKADTLQAKVTEYETEIANTQNRIELIDLKIKKLNLEITKAEEELAYNKAVMGESLKELYKRGDITTIELIASSESYSDFINQQEYLSRLKSSIYDATVKIEELKKQLESSRKQQEELKSELEGQQRILDNQRAEQQALLDQTLGEEAKYQSIVDRLKKEQREAENALVAAIGSGTYKAAPIGPVTAGEIIGNVGNSGLSSGPHLHLEVRIGGAVTNPAPHIRQSPVIPVLVTQSFWNPDPIYYSGHHPGIDYAPGNGAIYAIDNGYLYRGCSNNLLGTSNNAYGYVAIVDHGGGKISVYAHMGGGPSACNFNTYY